VDPIVAVYEITLTMRAPDDSDVEAPTVEHIEEILAAALVADAALEDHIVSANAIAKRTDR
jgi:hypothetical protein